MRTHLFSTLGVATGSAVEEVVFDVPSGLAPGAYQLVVIANGIASLPTTVQIRPAIPAIAVDPHHDLAFGTVCHGPAYLALEIFNVGGLDLIIDSVQRLSGSTDFTVLPNPVTPLTIAPGDHVDFTVEFNPTTRGVGESAIIRIVSNDPVTPNFDLNPTGLLGIGRLETIIADHGDFGRACLGNSIDKALTLSNNGPCRLTILGMSSSSPEFQVPSVQAYPLVLEAGSSIEMPIRFEPNSFGSKSATITITSDDPSGAKAVRVSGTAAAPALTLMIPDHGDFGHVCIGSFADEGLTLNNNGYCTLEVSAIVSSAPEFVVPNVVSYPLKIVAGTSLEIPIRFKPASHGAHTSTITVTSNDPSGPKTVSLSGTTPWGKLAVTGSAYFGDVPCGFAEKTIAICNVGDCDLHVKRVAFHRKRRHFRLINNPFPATLRPGSCLGIVIQYRAHCEPECCELVIESDDPETPVRCLDVIAFTRCVEKCGCGKKDCGCRRNDCCDDDDRRRHDEDEDD